MELSIFATSIRLHHWLPFFANIQAATTAEFEIVFSGPHQPNFALPPNFKFIFAEDKTARAMEIARLACSGDYLLQAVDDVRWSARSIDLMLAACKADPKVIASCKFCIDGGYREAAHKQSIFSDATGPLMPICGMAARKSWPAADPRFQWQYSETDCYLQLLASGFRTVLVDGECNETTIGSSLWDTKGQDDLQILRGLWCENGSYRPSKRGIQFDASHSS